MVGSGTPTYRPTARLLPVNEFGQVLLLLDQDPERPGVLRWGTIGGAIDAGESVEAAALRELREETGIEADAGSLTPAFHRETREFSYAGRDYLADATFFAIRLRHDVEISFDLLEPAEVGHVFEARWFTPDQAREDGRLINPDVPAIMAMAIEAVATSAGPDATGDPGDPA